MHFKGILYAFYIYGIRNVYACMFLQPFLKVNALDGNAEIVAQEHVKGYLHL